MTNSHTELVGTVLSVGLILSASACTPGDIEAGADSSTEGGSLQATNPAVWEAVSPSGTGVTVTAEPYPVRVGDMHFHIAFDQAVPDSVPVSIDIVSPEMPMMGIQRYAAQRMTSGDYMVAAPIMMDGVWQIYVNLGMGADAASFEFEAEAGEEGAGHLHGASAEVTDESEPGEAPKPISHDGH